jgi:hypothetical protein
MLPKPTGIIDTPYHNWMGEEKKQTFKRRDQAARLGFGFNEKLLEMILFGCHYQN